VTDISTTPTTARPLDLPRPGSPRPGIGASFAAIFGLLGNAITMAYVEPYAARHRRSRAVPDDDLQGRDPGW
jgi:hypothetical protein